MKKINLSIPEPCDENWGNMTPADKGRFCASCQKTVVDFTNMSDRQLAEFFKRPLGNMCGRFHPDQLTRDIEIPKKRIPWVKYFFQFTWPAFVLFLKSCGIKENLKGKVKVESRTAEVREHSFAALGVMMTEITPVDTTVVMKEEYTMHGEIMSDVKGTPITIDSIDSLLENTEIVYTPMDTVVIQSYGTTTGKIMLGGISVCRFETAQQEREPVKDEIQVDKELKFNVYPNPIRSGALLNISFESTNDFRK